MLAALVLTLAVGAAEPPAKEPAAKLELFAKEDWYKDYLRKYCMDARFLGAIERAKQVAKSDYPPLEEERIAYILTSGRNWAGPIQSFRLVVDKGDPQNLVSFCGDGVKKIAPTQFEIRKADYVPGTDLDVLILTEHPQR